MPAATLDGDATAQRGAVSRLRRLAVRVAPFIRPAVAVAILAAIGYAVASLWSGSPGKPGIRDALSTLAWPSVVLAFGCILAGTFTSLMAWRTLLADEGHRLRIAPAAQIFLVGQLGKYLPGSVWAVVVQMELARRHRVPRSRAFTTSLIFVGLSLSTALVVGLMGLPVIAATNHPELW